MNGRAGLAAWRWLFIFDAIISIPVAIFGIFVCPSTYQLFPSPTYRGASYFFIIANVECEQMNRVPRKCGG